MDLEGTEWEVDWFHLAQGRGKWRTFVNTVMIFLYFVDRASRHKFLLVTNLMHCVSNCLVCRSGPAYQAVTYTD